METQQQDEHRLKDRDKVILFFSVFVVATCGLVYELVAGAVSSYLLGDAVTQFSLVIGVFLSAMGLGSWFAKFITRDLLKRFIEIEIVIGLVGGTSSIAMFAVSALASPLFTPFFYTLCALLGALIGVEIPLLMRIIKGGSSFIESVSNVLALDYIGALAGSLLFPLVVLPLLGLSRSSLVFGVLNFAVAAFALHMLPKRSRAKTAAALIFASVLLVFAIVFSTRMVTFFEDLLYQDSIIYAQSTKVQRIVITRWRDDLRLFLNGHLQFASRDEARYHEPLILPAMEAAVKPHRVLILGGGDGIAAREILKYNSVEHIDLVDIDPVMTGLAQKHRELLAINKGSLNSPLVSIHNSDAFLYLQQCTDFYDCIIADLPDPSSDTMSKLYSTAFYALCFKHLSAQGVLVTQATSPYYAPGAFWSIEKTIRESVKGAGDTGGKIHTYPSHINVPSFGEWGFIMAARKEIKTEGLRLSVETSFLNNETMRGLYVFSKDLYPQKESRVNTLDNPVLYQLYEKGWNNYNE